MTVDENTLLSIAWGLLAAIAAGIIGVGRYLYACLTRQERRIANIERDMVSREEHSRVTTEVYTKIDAGFSNISSQLNTLYGILIEKLPK